MFTTKGNIKISIYNNLEDNMKFISWNVNGIRACVTKGFLDYFKEVDTIPVINDIRIIEE